MTRVDMVEQAPEKTKVTFSDGKAPGSARGNGVGGCPYVVCQAAAGSFVAGCGS